MKLQGDLTTNTKEVHREAREEDIISPKLFILALEGVFKQLNWDNEGIHIDGLTGHI